MSILVVGDGPRDSKALPIVVCSLVGKTVPTRYDDWHQVAYLRGKGSVFARKVKYLTRRARADQFAALAVVVDADRSPPRQKLRELRSGREEDRQKNAPFPTALGEACPCFDVWLLDDAIAVRNGLRLAGDVPIPNATQCGNAKQELSQLIADGPNRFPEVSDALGEIAGCLRADRCPHSRETGFDTFAQDVRDEIRPGVNA